MLITINIIIKPIKDLINAALSPDKELELKKVKQLKTKFI